MAKLIHAKEALKLANAKHSLDNQLEYINAQIETAARNGEFSISLKLQSPKESADTIVRFLRLKGYEVLYSEVGSTYVTVRVWWV